MKILIFCLGLLISWQALGISRVGKSSVGDTEEGFRAPINESFVIARPLSEGGLKVSAPFSGSINGNSSRPPELRLFRFRHQFENLAKLNSIELDAYMNESYPKWQKFAAIEKCIVVYVVRGNEGSAALATWGQGYGFTIATGDSDIEWQSMLMTLRNIELSGGDCKWQ